MVDKTDHAIILSIAGNIVMGIAFVFLGPAPYLTGLEPNVNLIFGMVALIGLGYALIAVSTFARALKESVKRGYSASIGTFVVISGKVPLKTTQPL